MDVSFAQYNSIQIDFIINHIRFEILEQSALPYDIHKALKNEHQLLSFVNLDYNLKSWRKRRKER